MRRYLLIQLFAISFFSAFMGLTAAQVATGQDVRLRIAQLPGGDELVQARKADTKRGMANFEQVLNFLMENYLEPVEDESKLIDGAIQGSVQALGDRYSRYVPPADSDALSEDISGFYGGIGVLIEPEDTHTVAATVFKGSPAEAAGMQVGDLLLQVDGTDVSKMWVTDIVQRIRGPVDTTVKVAVYRPLTGETLEFDIPRKNVKYPSVFEQKFLAEKERIGYIKLISFNEETGEDFTEAVKDLQGQGMQGLIVDLRANTGGTFEDALDIADLLVADGPLVFVEDREGNQTPAKSDDKGAALGIPLVILTDGFSASASEIVAGAVQDTRSGLIVGEKTFGKGVVQTVVPLTDGSMLILTTQRYLTPNKRDINKHGIRPDIPIDIEKVARQDPFLADRFDRLEALQAESLALRQQIQDYVRGRDLELDEALKIILDATRYGQLVSEPAPTPADDEAAWAAELAAAEGRTGDVTIPTPPSNNGEDVP